MTGPRKRIKHYHGPVDCHELTFSCYRRMPLLTNDLWRRMLCESIDRATQRHPFRLVAFVLMPEQVHLLVSPTVPKPEIGKSLYAVKRPYSERIKPLLIKSDSSLLTKLTIRERPGKTTFRYWQEGPGYDRNFSGERATLNAIDDIHEDPVRRGFVTRVRDWTWSSARWYESDGSQGGFQNYRHHTGSVGVT